MTKYQKSLRKKDRYRRSRRGRRLWSSISSKDLLYGLGKSTYALWQGQVAPGQPMTLEEIGKIWDTMRDIWLQK